MQRHDLFRKGKPDPGPVLTGAEKTVENVRQKLRRNAIPIVTETHDGFPSVCLTFDLYFLFCITVSIFINNLRYFVFMSVGSFTAIVVPLSELSSTRISPPCSATISHTNESPNPTPPFSLLLDLSTLKKG